MPDAYRLDKAFARLLRHHAYGWALFKKVAAKDMHPGSCGYFDPEGDWQPLVDLTRPSDDLLAEGWAAPDARLYHDEAPESLVWGPKSSRAVNANQSGGTAGAT
ncbi:hypothetical protein PG991_001732 [Apiospora marii]|uniref:Uncharacterized protein n=1 Tax=Apiospora marii TaxID=335849 RepID=A0ABR1SQI3_9PEZI